MPSVSVIIPTYNRAEWLPLTVASVLSQTQQPLEIIIIDDGSNDNTEAVCARFPEVVRYVRLDNLGVSTARNRGLRQARGDFIAFLDSDDLWEPTKLEVQMSVHQALPDVGWSITNCTVVDLHGRPLPEPQGLARAFPVFRDVGLSPDEVFSTCCSRLLVEAAGQRHKVYVGDAYETLFHGNFASASCASLRKTVVDRVGGFDESFRVAEDTEFFHRFAAASPVAIIMTPLFKWRVGYDNSLTSPRNVVSLVSGGIRSLDQAAQLRGKLSPTQRQAYRHTRTRLMLRLAYAQLSMLDGRAARSTVFEAWRTGARVTPRSLAIYAASLMPKLVLRGLHVVKRQLRW